MEANKEEIDSLNKIGLDSDQRAAVDAAMEEYAAEKLHLLQQKYDNLKEQTLALQTKHRLLVIALEDAGKQNIALKEENDKLKMQSELNYEVLVSEHAALKEKAEKMAAALRNITPYLSAPGTNGNHWLPEVDAALSSYNSNTNNQNENNG